MSAAKNIKSLIGALLLSAYVMASGPAYASEQTFTYGGDFDRGIAVGVEHKTIPDQLQLSREATTLPYIWVPNQDNTVSKLHTETGKELGRYRTCPPEVDGQPSRTTVDLEGNCWVANRFSGTVVKIGLLEAGGWTDRNKNGSVETSRDLNGDGDITGAEILPWGEDECVLYEVVLIPGSEGAHRPGAYAGEYSSSWSFPGPRALAIDARNNLWVGCYGSGKFYYIDASSAEVVTTVDVSPWDHKAFGAVIDANGILWSADRNAQHALRVDPSTTPPGITRLNIGHLVHGLGLNFRDQMFVTAWTGRKLALIDVTSGAHEWTEFREEMKGGGGIAVTADNNLWISNNRDSTVTRYDDEANLIGSIPVIAKVPPPPPPPKLPMLPKGKELVWEWDCSTDPTKLDANNDGITDWIARPAHGAGRFSRAELRNGIWESRGTVTLDTRPQCNFNYPTTVEAKFKATKAGAPRGATVWINVDFTGGKYAPIHAVLSLENDNSQKLLIGSAGKPWKQYALVEYKGLPAGFIHLVMQFDPEADTLTVTLNGERKGTYDYSVIDSSDGNFATLQCSAGSFDYVRIETSAGPAKPAKHPPPPPPPPKVYPTGVAVDAAGKVWVCDGIDEYIHRIDPAASQIDLSKRIVGSYAHNTYGDMTGIVCRNVTTKLGSWSVVHDSGAADTQWGLVSWNCDEPEGTSVAVRARSSDDQVGWSPWEKAKNGAALNSTPAGRYLQVEVVLQSGAAVSPALLDLTVKSAVD